MSLTLAVLVSAALALGPAPSRPPAHFTELEAHVQELAGQKRYLELAQAGAAGFERRDLEPYQRRAMAFFAIRGLHGVFEETAQVSRLCDAGRLMRRVRAEVGFGDDAGTATRLKAATEKLLARTGKQDPCSKTKPAKGSPPAVAAAPSPPATEPTPAGPGQAAPAAHETAAAEDELLAVAPWTEAHTEDVSQDMSVKPGPVVGQTPPLPLHAPDRPSRDKARSDRLLHGALASLALGVVGSVGLGVSLHYRGRAGDTIDALRAKADMRGESMPEEYMQARDLNESYQRLTVVAGIGGALAVAGVVGSVTMFTLQARRGRTRTEPWVSPAGAGLSIRGRF